MPHPITAAGAGTFAGSPEAVRSTAGPGPDAGAEQVLLQIGSPEPLAHLERVAQLANDLAGGLAHPSAGAESVATDRSRASTVARVRS